jgi:hypothetical protein
MQPDCHAHAWLRAFRRFLIGSVTARVLHDSDCPVFTGTHCGETGAGKVGGSPPAVPVDFGPQSEAMLHWASVFAQDTTSLHIVTRCRMSSGEARYLNEEVQVSIAAQARRLSCWGTFRLKVK